MDLKKKLRALAASCRKSDAGFTLVELVVVIAILGVLAGVGTVGYSGYVKKANIAADEALLSAVNTAFAVACVDNGANIYELGDQPKLLLTAQKAVNGVDMFNDEFMDYYGENASTFKTDYSVVFDGDKGAFILFVDGTTVTVNYNGGKITVSAEDAQKLKDSSFVQAEGLGVDGLLEKVNFVAGFATAIDSTTYSNILGSDDYKKSFLKALGMDAATVDGMGSRALSNAYRDKLSDMEMQMQSQGLTPAEASKKLEANMMVLYAAQNTQNLTPDQITALLNSSTPKTDILAAASGANISQAALYYGMYTSYAYSTNNSELIAKTGDPLALFNAMTDAETAAFKQYINSDQGKKDLDAYLASMKVITDATKDNKAGVEGVLTNNFNDPELVKLFQQVVGG